VSTGVELPYAINDYLAEVSGYGGMWVIDREHSDMMVAVHLALQGKISIETLKSCSINGVGELESLPFFQEFRNSHLYKDANTCYRC